MNRATIMRIGRIVPKLPNLRHISLPYPVSTVGIWETGTLSAKNKTIILICGYRPTTWFLRRSNSSNTVTVYDIFRIYYIERTWARNGRQRACYVSGYNRFWNAGLGILFVILYNIRPISYRLHAIWLLEFTWAQNGLWRAWKVEGLAQWILKLCSPYYNF